MIVLLPKEKVGSFLGFRRNDGRAKDYEVGKKIYALVDWFKEYVSKFGAVLNQNPSAGNIKVGLLNITIKSLGAIAKAGTTRVEDCVEYAETPTKRGINLMQGPRLRSGINARTGCRRRDCRNFYDRTRNNHRQRDCAGYQTRVKQRGF